MAILRQGRIGDIYHLSPDSGIAVRDVVQRIANQMHKTLDEVATVVDERPGQDAAYVIDSSKARQQLHWQPQTELDEGIAEVIQWVQQYWKEIQQLPLEYEHKQ